MDVIYRIKAKWEKWRSKTRILCDHRILTKLKKKLIGSYIISYAIYMAYNIK